MQQRKRISEATRRAIIKLFAEWKTEPEIREELNLGEGISRQGIMRYDAGNPACRARLAQKHIDAFDAHRATFVASFDHVDVSHKAFRLTEISALYRQAKKNGDSEARLKVLEAARAECLGSLEEDRQLIQIILRSMATEAQNGDS